MAFSIRRRPRIRIRASVRAVHPHERRPPDTVFPGGIQIERHIDELPLGADRRVSVLRGAGSAIAQLAVGGGRNGRPVEARSRFRAGLRGPRLFVRDRRKRRGAIGGHYGARRRDLPVSRLRAGDDGDQIKKQAQAGQLGEQLYAIVYKKRIPKVLKSGKRGKDKWVRGYRAPCPEDDNGAEIAARLAEKLPEWEAFDIVPSEKIPEGLKTEEPRRYGMTMWRDLFSPRQLLCHGASVEVFREMLDADRDTGGLDEARKAAYGYLALSPDKLLNYNSRMSVWMPTREVVANTFNRHDFAFCWSHGEMAPPIVGLGYDWAIGQTAKCIGELVALVRPEGDGLFEGTEPPSVTTTCKPGDGLDHIADGAIDAVVMDPPYYDNVMYAELSDFFYVWLKRTAGHVFPELFRRHVTDKDNEAVANPARFRGEKGARALAGRDYQERMASIFAECRRVLKPDGIMGKVTNYVSEGTDSLLFVFVDEDSEQDAVHRGLESAQRSSPDLPSLDSVGGSDLPASIGVLVAETGQQIVEIVAQACDGPGVCIFPACGEAPGGAPGLSVVGAAAWRSCLTASCCEPCRGHILCARQRWTGMPWYVVGRAASKPWPPSTQIISRPSPVRPRA